MPYANDTAGIYRVTDTIAGTCYVGQSRRLKKRLAEHMRLLRLGIHPNQHMQESFEANGEDAFRTEIEVEVEDPSDLDVIEEAFLQGNAWFDESPRLFNISSTTHTPMSGRKHSEASRAKISKAKAGRTGHVTPEYRAKLSAAQRARAMSNPTTRARIKFIVNHPEMSYAERARRTGTDTSTARKLAIKYAYLKGKI